MEILISCEESGSVRDAFTLMGHNTTSCDLMPSRTPGKHYQGNIFDILDDDWDLIISFPPCTDLALSGAKHFEKKRGDGRQEKSIRFFFEIWKVSDCTENPMGIMNGGGYIKKWFPELYAEMLSFGFPFKASQIIQPWQFGDEAQKTTCLWLKELPLLYHNAAPNLFDSKVTHVGKGRFYTSPQGKKLPSWCGDVIGVDGKKLSYNGDEIKKVRSKTFPGIANAMAEQWG